MSIFNYFLGLIHVTRYFYQNQFYVDVLVIHCEIFAHVIDFMRIFYLFCKRQQNIKGNLYIYLSELCFLVVFTNADK